MSTEYTEHEAEHENVQLLPWLRQQATDTAAVLTRGMRWAVGLVARLGEGSVQLGPRLAAHLAAWVRRGHRADLSGVSAYLGNGLRVVALVAAAYGAWRLADRHHWVMAPAAGGWLLAAYQCHRANGQWPALPGRRAEQPDEGAAELPPELPAEPPVVALVRAQIGEDEGVHLSELYPAMREHLEGCADAPDEQLRQMLTDHHLTVARTVRSRGVAGRSGIRRSALPPLPSPKTSLRKASPALSIDGDAGQSAPMESDGEGWERGGEGGEHVYRQDPDNPHRWRVTRSGD
ncbi:hypothetical protein ACIQU6_41635 [Streptomyces sp. NPDC090442]|uniref:hypothetical protein n=1 Tax=Streptomyces sp. NPDC090442 TaxID=3365962 RepID=UPI0038261488